jgi:hypothetical protein
MNTAAFLKRFPGAKEVGLVTPGRYSEPLAERARTNLHARLRTFSQPLARLAIDAVKMVKGPMQEPTPESDDPYGKQPNTPEKQTASHAIKAVQHVQESPNPDTNEVLEHLQAAIQACKQSPRGHELLPHIQHLYQQIAAGGAHPEQDETTGDSDQWTRKY